MSKPRKNHVDAKLAAITAEISVYCGHAKEALDRFHEYCNARMSARDAQFCVNATGLASLMLEGLADHCIELTKGRLQPPKNGSKTG